MHFYIFNVYCFLFVLIRMGPYDFFAMILGENLPKFQDHLLPLKETCQSFPL